MIGKYQLVLPLWIQVNINEFFEGRVAINQAILRNYIQIMSEYPLSTKSSKKSRPPRPAALPAALHSPLHERSACQSALGQPLRREDYGHILHGERVFIEIYYQGRVVQTAYPDYITFMGGQLCKRLNPKVSLFITNLQPREMAPIKERVGRTCPHCRVVSILWFEHCYQSKQKLPFDKYELDREIELSDERSKDSFQESDLTEFLANIGEDAENQFKEFFKTDKKRYFDNLPKNHNKPLEEIFAIKDYDLGPNPEKKNRPKNDNTRKRRKSMKPGNSERKGVSLGRELKSSGPQLLARVEGEEGEIEGEEQEQEDGVKIEEGQAKQEIASQMSVNLMKIATVENVVTKYLGMENDYLTEEKDPSSATVKSRRTPLVSENNHTFSKQPPSENIGVRPVMGSIISKKSIQSSGLDDKKQRETHRFTFSKVGTRYKDLHKQGESHSIDILQLENSLAAIGRGSENVLLVMTASAAAEKMMREMNKQAVHHSAITFHIVKYTHFASIAQRTSNPAELYFLISPKKTSDRALFLSLTLLQSPLKLKLVSHRLIDEVAAYNAQVRNAQLRSPIKLQRTRLKYIKELSYEASGGFVKGKRVAVLNSELPCSVQQRVIEALGGEYVAKENYLLNANVDLIVTDRMGCLQDRGALTVSDQAFWRRLIRLEGDSQ